MTIQDQLIFIKQQASYLKQLKSDEDFLIDELNSILAQDTGENRLKQIHERYSHSSNRPVNRLRRIVAKKLLDEDVVTSKLIDQEISRILIENPDKDSFKSWKNRFHIFYLFFIEDDNLVVKLFKDLAVLLITDLEIEQDVNTHIVDFNGSQYFGSDRVWMAIYNKSHPNQQSAYQLFFEVNAAGIRATFYHRPTDDHKELDLTLNTFSIEKLVSLYLPFTKQIINDIYLGSEPSKNVIALNTEQRLFKLSYGIFGNLTDVNSYLKNNNLIIIHEEIGKGQVEVFESLKRNDYVYVTMGSQELIYIARIIDDKADISQFDESIVGEKGWLQRKIEPTVLPVSSDVSSLKDQRSLYMPSGNRTIAEVPADKLGEVNRLLFEPYFNASFSKVEIKESSFNSGEFGISDSNVQPKLDVKILATHFASLISSLESNLGQMIGVFGKWGRGKTFFIKQVCQQLNIDFDLGKSLDDSKFHFIKFHAWKYQDTEAVWAYLYESFADTYFDHNKNSYWSFLKWKFKKPEFFTRFQLIIRLNVTRYGTRDFWLLGIGLLGLVLTFVIKAIWPTLQNEIISFLSRLIQLLGLVGLISMIYRIIMIYRNGRRIVIKYTHRKSFNELLGIQAEIQRELKYLLKAWFGKNYEKKVLLFVDDIDRCSEKRIIQIIDALRVMLEDFDIAKSVIVIAAIDEEILERSILWKYDEIMRFSSSNLNSPDNQDLNFRKSANELVREYMDKLFICGIKLSELNESDIGVILENYVNSGGLLEKNSKADVHEKERNTSPDTISEQESKQNEPVAISINEKTNDQKIEESNEEFLISRSELDFLKRNATDFVKPTPRQLRIYLYRYLLAKNIARSYIDSENEAEDLTESWCNKLAAEIIKKSNDQNYNLNSLRTDAVSDIYISKLVEIVVPY